MLYHLFMAGRRKRGEEGEEVTVTFEHILRFTTAAETESLLGFQIDPSIIFVESFCGSIFVGKFLPRAGNLYNLPNGKRCLIFTNTLFSSLTLDKKKCLAVS